MFRTNFAKFSVILIFLFLFLGLFNLEVIQGRHFQELSNKNCIRLLPQEGSRGRIFDRDGNLIVGSELSYDLMLLPQSVNSVDKTLAEVARILGADPEDLKNKFKNGFIGNFAGVTLAKNITLKQAIALEELRADFPGIMIQPHPNRSYPFGRLASHVLGYLSGIDRWRLTHLADYGYNTTDIVGFGGIEEEYDYYLRQEEGGLCVEVDHRGRLVRTLGLRPPRHGKDIQLTLNLKIQKIVEDNLEGKVGCVIVMDPQTGEILALASFPNFSPAVFVKRSNSAIRSLFRNSEAPLMNRAISGVYPAGSVFKLVVATAALETGKINLSRTFFCAGKMHIGKSDFSCWDTHGSQNLIGAITHSCNIFFYNTGLVVGAQLIHDYALRFGFSRPTGIDLPYEANGFIPSPLWSKVYRLRNWFDGDTANLAIGQGEVLVTPLQIARMMAVFANQGILLTPYLVRAIDGRDISAYQRKAIPLAIKESTLDAIRQGLRRVVSDPTGTASNLSTLSVAVAGKTGTAQAPPGLPHGWFAGFLPFKNPKFVICVFLERGGAGYYASSLAKQIIEMMIKEGLV